MPVYCVNYIKTNISIYKYQYINIYMFHVSNVTTSAVSVNFTHKPVLEELSCDGAKEGFPLLDKKKGKRPINVLKIYISRGFNDI